MGSRSFKSSARTTILLRTMETNSTPSRLLCSTLISGPTKATPIQPKAPHASLSQKRCKLRAPRAERSTTSCSPPALQTSFPSLPKQEPGGEEH